MTWSQSSSSTFSWLTTSKWGRRQRNSDDVKQFFFCFLPFRMCDSHHMCVWALAIYRIVEGRNSWRRCSFICQRVMSTFFMRKSISFIGPQTSHLGNNKKLTIYAVKWRKHRRSTGTDYCFMDRKYDHMRTAAKKKMKRQISGAHKKRLSQFIIHILQAKCGTCSCTVQRTKSRSRRDWETLRLRGETRRKKYE